MEDRAEYIAVDKVFLNDIHFADGSEISGIMGADIFAYAGLLQYTANALFVFGAGQEDFERHFGGWFDANGASRQGLCPYPGRTTLATMQYQADGQWRETFAYGPPRFPQADCPLYGDVAEKLAAVTARGRTKGLYLAGGTRMMPYMRAIARLREERGFAVMLELYTGDCRAENLQAITDELLPLVDVFSLNRTEAASLFGAKEESEAIARLVGLGKPCFFRAGRKGAYMVMDGEAVFMPAVHLVPREEEIDPTGCGNCSTAAALWGFCEGYAPGQIACIGNVAAAYNARQYGPWPAFTPLLRRAALQKALALAEENGEGGARP